MRKNKMKKELLREAVRTALKEVAGEKPKTSNEPETFVPVEKEHLTENKLLLNEELMRRWGFKKNK
jgi:hypothetical protein